MATFDTSSDRRLKELASGLVVADIGVLVQAFDNTLQALSAFNSNGYLVQTAHDTFVSRVIQEGSTKVTVTNGDGIAGNTLIDVVPANILGESSTSFLPEGANLYFTDERAQDAVGSILTDSASIDFTYDDALGTITASIVAGSVAPSNATYITQTPNANLSSEQAISLLTSGILVGTNATGVILSRSLAIGSTKLSITNADGIAGNPTYDVNEGNLIHNNLGGLTVGDPHTQYALLAGRAGGQTLKGGTAAGESLTLQSTNHATKGLVKLGTASAYDEVNDFLGIGVLAPAFDAHVKRQSATGPILAMDCVGLGNGSIIGRRANGTIGAESALALDNQMFIMGARGYGATGYSSASRVAIGYYAAEAWTDAAQGTYIKFFTTPTGSTVIAERMRLVASGRLGVGETTPQGILHIKGTGAARDNGWDSSIEIDSNTTNFVPAIIFANTQDGGGGGFSWNTSTSGNDATKEAAFIEFLRSGTTGALLFYINGNIGTTTTAEAMNLNTAGLGFGGSQGAIRTDLGVGVYSSTPTYNNGNPWHFKASNAADTKAAVFGWDETNSIGVLEAVEHGVAWKNFAINPNGANLAIGHSAAPIAPVDLGNTTGKKLALYANGGTFQYGFEIQSGELRHHASTAGAGGFHSFYTNNTERVRIDDNELKFLRGLKGSRTNVADAAYTQLVSDFIISYGTLTAARTVTLASAASNGDGKIIIIKDAAGTAAANNITVDANASETIDGALTQKITTNYGVMRLFCNGSNWFTW